MKVVSVEKPTNEEFFYRELIVKSLKNDIDLYDRIFPSLLTVSGIFISANILTGGVMGLVLILISFFAFLFSFIGIVPIEKDIPIFQPDEMKKFILSRKKDKKILLYSSVFLLLFAFACSLVFLILKTLRR